MLDNIKLVVMLIVTIIAIVVVIVGFVAKVHCGLAYGNLPITDIPSYCVMLLSK